MAELVVKDAEKWFRREDGSPFKIIDRLSFAARAGCVTVLIGPSGCGKSTLLNSVVGLEKLDRGELQFSAKARISTAADRLRISEPAPAAVENHRRESRSRLKGRRRGARRMELARRTISAARRPRRIHQSVPAVFSGGQRQRVGLARALAVESDVVLMDEPFASVDELTARQLRRDHAPAVRAVASDGFLRHPQPRRSGVHERFRRYSHPPAGNARRLCDQPAPDAAPLGPEIYGFAAQLETKVTLKEEEDS